jgi:glycerol kinase
MGKGPRLLDSAADIDPMLNGYTPGSGPLFVPGLLGLAAPHWSPDAKGSWHGLDAGTTRRDLVFSVVESIAFRIGEVIEAVKQTGIEVNMLMTDGGLTKSASLMRLVSNVLQIPVAVFEGSEATAYGAGLLAGMACGLWDGTDLQRTETSVRYEPENRDGERELNRFTRWKELVSQQVKEAQP